MRTENAQISEFTQTSFASSDADAQPTDTGFGAEYRDLARQRRFQRSDAPRTEPTPARAPARPAHPTAQSRPQAQTHPAEPAPHEVHERLRRSPSATAARDLRERRGLEQRSPAPRPHRPQTHVEKLTSDPMLMIAELSRMADRVIESREALVLASTRIAQLEREKKAADDRIMAARALVAQAQAAARDAADQVVFLEGRIDALDHALDLALNASMVQRWKWRRRVKSGGSPAFD